MRVSYPSYRTRRFWGLQVALDAGYQGKTPKDRSGMFLTNKVDASSEIIQQDLWMDKSALKLVPLDSARRATPLSRNGRDRLLQATDVPR
jgi:hypothetical protein